MLGGQNKLTNSERSIINGSPATNDQPAINGNAAVDGHSATNGHAAINGHSAINGQHSTNGLATNGYPATNGISRCPFASAMSNGVQKPIRKPQVLKNLMDGSSMTDTLHHNSIPNMPCKENVCSGSIYMPVKDDTGPGELRSIENLKKEATTFLKEYYASLKKENSESHIKRLEQVIDEIDRTDTYELEEKELIFGAKTAWRNAPRCNGRIQWKKLQVFDARHVTTAKEMYDFLIRHLKYGTNNGKLRSTITVFPHKKARMSEFRMWNAQMIRYAGYKQPDGSIIGDPASVEFTEICESLGWKGAGTQFDVIPWVLSAPSQPPELFEIPPELILEVNITHPQYPGIDKLGLKWYALPAVANMFLDCGGLQFTACPFNGWYNATEIGARNFTDTCRYNLMKPVAEVCGFDTNNIASLWKDKVAVELTYAVIYSFQKDGVTIADHHTSAESFMKHIKDEEKLRGGCPTDWVWVVPPLSGGIIPMFHQEFLNYTLRPSYEYQLDAWKYLPLLKKENDASKGTKKKTFKDVMRAVKFSSSMMTKAMGKRMKATILYGTETGRSEKFAHILNEIFLFAFDSKVICMDEYDMDNLPREDCLMVVTSTFGNGEAPDNGQTFQDSLEKLIETSTVEGLSEKSIEILSSVRYAVFGLGSRAYPHFCSFAHILNKLLTKLGGEEICDVGEGDELCGQQESFNSWAADAFKAACDAFGIYDIDFDAAISSITKSAKDWKPGFFRLVKASNVETEDVFKSLSVLHRKKVVPTKCISVDNLQDPKSERVTDLVKIDRDGHQEITYQPGDHLSVFPNNEKRLVDALLERVELDVDPDEFVRLECKEGNNWVESSKFPFATTLRRMFTSYLDITTPPSTKVLSILAAQCIGEGEKKELEKLSTDNDAHEEWLHTLYPNMVEILDQYPSVSCDVTILVNHLGLLNPRNYSISSSQDLHPDEVHATVAVVSYDVNGTTHNGVCSNYLHTLKPGDTVPCCIRRAPAFHLPVEKTTPVIMIGPGTGIAPFRSFWQQVTYEKQCEGVSNREMALYFGCRNSKLDDIYGVETRKAREEGCLKSVKTAYSREENFEKTYVQNLLQRDMEEVGEAILSKKGHIYVCGDVKMATDVSKVLTSVLQEYDAFSDEEAKAYMAELKSTGRYHEDIFGVTLKVKETTARVRKGALRLKKQRTLKPQEQN